MLYFFLDQQYTVFVPTDHAFHRWHPIDWGFYPFSVPEFTENVIVNHFLKGNYKQETIKDGEIAYTLGGREVLFRKIRKKSLSINYYFVKRIVIIHSFSF